MRVWWRRHEPVTSSSVASYKTLEAAPSQLESRHPRPSRQAPLRSDTLRHSGAVADATPWSRGGVHAAHVCPHVLVHIQGAAQVARCRHRVKRGERCVIGERCRTGAARHLDETLGAADRARPMVEAVMLCRRRWTKGACASGKDAHTESAANTRCTPGHARHAATEHVKSEPNYGPKRTAGTVQIGGWLCGAGCA